MKLESLRRGRRMLSAAVSLAAMALVMARARGPAAGGDRVGLIASVAFMLTLVLLILVWRKEHVASEIAFAARAEQRLVFMRRQIELAKSEPAENQRAGPGP